MVPSYIGPLGTLSDTFGTGTVEGEGGEGGKESYNHKISKVVSTHR